MNALAEYDVEELDATARAGTTGGNPVPLGISLASAFAWGFRWGYNVAGPWLVDNT